MDRFFRYIFTVAIVGLLWSCNDDMDGVIGDGTATMRINATVSSTDTLSRAVYTEPQEVSNVNRFCLLVYSGTDANATLYQAYDIAQFPVTKEMSLSVGATYQGVLLGNVSLSDLGNSAVVGTSTLADLAVPAFSIDRQYNKPKSGEITNFTWSGSLRFNISQSQLDFVLNPNVAKVTAKITNSSNNSESTITSVRVKNVPNKVRFAQNALNETSVIDATAVGGVEYVKYDNEELKLAKGASTTISWYVPQNAQGVVSTSGNRADIAPANATYIEIDGTRSNGITASYKIYPGTDISGTTAYNNLKDFNIWADHCYNVNVTINNDGIYYSLDSKVTTDFPGQTTKVKCEPHTNCWFIHPRIQKINGVTVWELPIDRVNDYWKTVKNDATHSIDANSEWTVDVIWQDQNARVIHFCDEYGNYTNNGSNNTFNGKGLNPMYITLDNTTLNSSYKNASRNPKTDIYGNILIGLKKTGVSGYLWSWHLWVTDYCPDYAPANTTYMTLYHNNASGTDVDYQGAKMWSTSNKRYEYVYDGRVEHYYHWGSDTWTTPSRNIWTKDGGIYKNKWIMDRHLGAQAPYNGLAESPVEGFGLYYQYGRKDPFPFQGATLANTSTGLETYPLYNITGATRANWTANSGSVSVAQSIQDPTKCYSNYGSSNNSWSTEHNTNPWYSPSATDSKGATFASSGRKTLFDPCPPGWCIPQLNAFDFMFSNNTYYAGIVDETLSKVYAYFGSGTTNPSGKFRHYVRTSVHTGDKNYLKISFPIQGFISPSSSKLFLPSDDVSTDGSGDYRGYLWTMNSASNTLAPGIGFGFGSDAYTNLANIKSNGIGRYFTDYWVGEGSSIVYDGNWGIDGNAIYKESFSPSRGQNVRCIQEPN